MDFFISIGGTKTYKDWLNIATKMSRDREMARDLIQEVAYLFIKKAPKADNVDAFVYRTIKNTYLNTIDKKRTAKLCAIDVSSLESGKDLNIVQREFAKHLVDNNTPEMDMLIKEANLTITNFKTTLSDLQKDILEDVLTGSTTSDAFYKMRNIPRQVYRYQHYRPVKEQFEELCQTLI